MAAIRGGGKVVKLVELAEHGLQNAMSLAQQILVCPEMTTYWIFPRFQNSGYIQK